MTRRRVRRRRPALVGEPLSPSRKWKAITLASLVLAPAMWSLVAGLIAASEEVDGGPEPAAAIALGLALVPFVFVTLAFASRHPNAPMAVVKAMGLSLVVGAIVSAMAVDGITGLVAGVGAGGVVALRAEPHHRTGVRAVAVVVASVYTLVMVRIAGAFVLVPAPAFPLTAIALADHWVEWRTERAS